MSQDQVTAAMAPISRRKVLKWGLTGLAVAGGVAGGTLALLGRSDVDEVPLPGWVTHLSAQEYHLFHHSLAILLPLEGSGLVPVDVHRVMGNIDAMFGLFPKDIRKQIKDGLALFDYAPIVSGWYGKRFVELSPQQGVAFFDAWSEGNLIQRALSSTVKKVVYVSYWRDPETWGPVQFDGPVSDKWGIPSLGNTPLPRETAEQIQQGGA